MHLLLIGIGGALGALLRYGTVSAVQRIAPQSFPWGTLTVNVAGSFALGFLLLTADRLLLSEATRRFAAIGVLGAFTTFSSFTFEVVFLLRQGEWLRAATYAAGSVVICVIALAGGGAVASAAFPPTHG